MRFSYLSDTSKQAYDRALELYSNEKDKYHTIHHVNYMLSLSNHYWNEFNACCNERISQEEKEAIYESIIFHDCIYVPGSCTNEEDSADEADAFLREMGFDRKFRRRVEDLILSTRVGEKLDDDSKKFIHDLDWSYFITCEEILDAERKIFNEYRDEGFILREVFKLRLKFYSDLDSSNEKILFNVFEKYDSIARSNISKRIIEFSYSI